MCGIAGFFHRMAPVEQCHATLKSMLQQIVHRGPDGQGELVWEEIGVYAGMQRLSIIDLKGGGQPIWNEDKTIAVLFNGEIYNYRELRAELLTRNHVFRTESDTEVLVHLYEELGADFLYKLRGMFAIFILDKPQRQALFARDHFGQKPLYIYQDRQTFAFASEIKAFRAAPFCDLEIRNEKLLDYMIWHSLPPPETHFKNVRKLRAGEFVKIDLPWGKKSEVSPKKYWSIDYPVERQIRSLDEAVTRIDEVLTDSIRHHLRADVPVGIMLSGGLDSRSIAAYASEIGSDLRSFTAVFAGDSSEQSEAAKTAKQFGTRHYEINITAQKFLEYLPEVAWYLDEPVCDPACTAVLLICREARNWVKVLLSGEGADELMAGYEQRYLGRLATLARSRKLRSLIGWMHGCGRSGYPLSKWQRAKHRAASTAGEESIELAIPGLPGNPTRPIGLSRPQLDYIVLRASELSASTYRPQRDDLSSLLTLDTEWELPEVLLQKADKMSMAASIELRTPFLDVPLSKIMTALSSDLKLPANGPGKYALRRCLMRKAAENDLSRPKKGFPMPLEQWLGVDLRDQIESTLFATNVSWDRTLHRRHVQSAWDQFLQGDTALSRSFYALWLYEHWYQQFSRTSA